MTDTDPLDAATVCPVEDCRALVPATTEDRRAHRAGHAHRAKIDRALREELIKLRTEVASVRDEHATLRKIIGELPIPATVEAGLHLEDWPEDELEPVEDDPDGDVDPLAPDATVIGLHLADRAGTEEISAPDATEPTAGEPDEDAASLDDDLDDGYVDLPVTGPRRF